MPAAWWPGGPWTVDPPPISAAWATVCVALLALGAALWAGSTARRLLEVEQKREDRADEAEARRTKADAQSLQADQVAVWTDWVAEAREPDGEAFYRTYVAEVHNNSLLPIYDVHVAFVGPDGQRFEAKKTFGVVRPGGHAVPIPEELWDMVIDDQAAAKAGASKLYEPSDLDSELRAELSFRDTAGQRWLRDRDGRLVELPTPAEGP